MEWLRLADLGGKVHMKIKVHKTENSGFTLELSQESEAESEILKSSWRDGRLLEFYGNSHGYFIRPVSISRHTGRCGINDAEMHATRLRTLAHAPAQNPIVTSWLMEIADLLSLE